MTEITLKIDGMMCGMCEAHMNDAVRNALKVKKVTSSHSAKETVIVTEEDVSDEKLGEIVKGAGYSLEGIARKPYEKKGILGIFKK
ncbi:MAG: ATPase P [Clostridia bacterium]|nr:ATPase P [Clostridia bacterium]